MHCRLLTLYTYFSIAILCTWTDRLEVFATVASNIPDSGFVYNISDGDDIECLPNGAANYSWSIVLINGTSKLISSSHSLTRLDLLLYKERSYTCIATLANGTVTSSTYEITFAYTSQDPMFDIQSRSPSPNTLQIDWLTFVHTVPISEYSLYICSHFLASVEVCTEDRYERREIVFSDVTTLLDTDKLQFNNSLILSDLLPFHHFHLRLNYSYSDTFGVRELNVSTETGPPFLNDFEVYIQWVGMRQLFVTWVPLEPRHTSNSSVTYIIKLYNAYGAAVLTKFVPVSFENRITLNLDGNEEYYVQLCAQNAFGTSCIASIKSGTYTAPPENELLTKLPLILIILLAVLIYFALVIICCLLVALFRRRSKYRRATKNAGGEFQLTPPKRSPNLLQPAAHQLALYETERDSGISDHRSRTSDECREQVALASELGEARIRNSKIPLRHLKPCLEQHVDNSCQLAIEEFSDLRKGLLREATVGLLPENKKKNRHPNICPYDFNRVRLEDSYYINASLIEQEWLTYSYITTQGPLLATVSSFWQMVWEKNTTVIVMLSSEPGESTCEKYWPEVGSTLAAENIEVTHDKSQTLGHFIQRNFTLKSPSMSQEKMKVTQLHFTFWPQNSLPLHPHFLWQFIAKVHRHHSSNAHSPLLLHCPDGSNQCGLFLVLFELLLELIQHEPEEMNVFELIQRLREERTSFIPTPDQYCFIYRALLDQVYRNDTSIQKQNFEITCKYMNQSIETASNLYKEQFDSLIVSCPDPSPEQLSDARHPVNLPKNRYEDLLPNNLFRVPLDIRLTGETSDYINASYIDSYTQRRAFIATQGPLEHTVPQFWSMVVSTKASLIVMLTNLYEDGKEMCAHYWPTSTEMLTIKNLQVSFVDELELGKFKQREYLVSSGSHKQQVFQLHIPNWSVDGAPPDYSDILHLVKHTSRLQRSVSADRPVIVHCSDGIGRTGTFLSIYLNLEQVVHEGVVDIFQTVKGLRVQRPRMVSSLKQYVYCHRTVLEGINKEFTFL